MCVELNGRCERYGIYRVCLAAHSIVSLLFLEISYNRKHFPLLIDYGDSQTPTSWGLRLIRGGGGRRKDVVPFLPAAHARKDSQEAWHGVCLSFVLF